MNRLPVFAVVTLMLAGILAGFYYVSKAPDDVVTALEEGYYRQAVVLMRDQVDDGNSVLLTTLANLYYLGLGVEQDFTESARLYSMAAFAGNSTAQINLGHLYSNGYGLEQDTQLAWAWFNLADSSGNAMARSYMSEMLVEHRLNFHLIDELRGKYTTLNNFPKLH